MMKNLKKQAVLVLTVMSAMGMTTMSAFAAENTKAAAELKTNIAAEAVPMKAATIAVTTKDSTGKENTKKSTVPYKVIKQLDGRYGLVNEKTGETIHIVFRAENGENTADAFVVTEIDKTMIKE